MDSPRDKILVNCMPRKHSFVLSLWLLREGSCFSLKTPACISGSLHPTLKDISMKSSVLGTTFAKLMRENEACFLFLCPSWLRFRVGLAGY